jgi:hypothetical protein
MDLARGELEYDRQTRLIDENVHLGGQPAARPMHIGRQIRPRPRRPFVPPLFGGGGGMLMHADRRRIDHLDFAVASGGPRRICGPRRRYSASGRAIVAGGRGSVALRDVRPRRAGAQSPVDAVQHHAIVAARGAPQIVFKPDRALGKAAPFKRNDAMLGIMPIGVIAFPGSGISANLVDKAREVGVAGASTAAVLNRFCPLLYRIAGTAMSDRVKPGMTVNRV